MKNDKTHILKYLNTIQPHVSQPQGNLTQPHVSQPQGNLT
jgi:hypothetical protein